MLNYEKRSPEYDFPLTFDNQKKLTELWPFFKKKKKMRITPMVAWKAVIPSSCYPCNFHFFLGGGGHNFVNFFCQLKQFSLMVKRKSKIGFQRPFSIIQHRKKSKNQKAGIFSPCHHWCYFHFFFFEKTAIIPSIFSGGQK